MTTVANQRVITVSKEKTDKLHKYTANNLEALDEAAKRLQSKGGFKLYMYLAKNQNNYNFALSSADFCMWSGLAIKAYRTAFSELIQQGYLIPKTNNEKETIFIFYDKSRIEQKNEENIIIEIPEEKVLETNKITRLLNDTKCDKEFIF